MAEARYGALIAKIDGEAPFAVGSQMSGVAATTGVLFLGINDLQSNDNTGDLAVEIRR